MAIIGFIFIIIIFGLIYAWSGNVFVSVLVVLGIIWICGEGEDKKVDKKKEKSNPSPAALDWYRKNIDNLISGCYDKTTRYFNWDLYFRERDAYIYCPYPQVVKYLKDELKDIGRDQIFYINYYVLYPAIHSGDYSKMIAELKGIEENIVRNLITACGGGEDSSCPSNIASYRMVLYDIMYKKSACDQTIIQKALDLVKEI